MFGPHHKIITAKRKKYLKIIDKFNEIYPFALIGSCFSKRLIYKYIERLKILNGTNNKKISPTFINYIPTPAFNKLVPS